MPVLLAALKRLLFFVSCLALAAVVAGLNAVNFAFEGWGDVLAALVTLGR